MGVFDGMGGEAFGEEASYMAACALKECCSACLGTPEEILLNACYSANDHLASQPENPGSPSIWELILPI